MKLAETAQRFRSAFQKHACMQEEWLGVLKWDASTRIR